MDFVVALAASSGGLGLLVAAFWLGVRHGIDWDHIAAITDITGTVEERRRAILFGTLYALGHAVVVFVLGVVAIALQNQLPPNVDEFMGRVVGVTLVFLGVWVFVSLIRHGRDFRLRSRWMLIFSSVRRGARWVKEHVAVGAPNGPGERGGVSIADADDRSGASWWHHGHHGRRGHHHHAEPERDEHYVGYGRSTAFGVGMIHGVGAETPTQVLLFLGAAGAGGNTIGILALLAFVVGLLVSNSIITIGSAFGFLQASRNFALYATVAVLTAVFSLAIGVLFLFGQESVLPAFFGG
jgi:ABC-type nickel/cobalt efflux system permease component RcnA